jgi:hypothetical protein
VRKDIDLPFILLNHELQVEEKEMMVKAWVQSTSSDNLVEVRNIQ